MKMPTLPSWPSPYIDNSVPSSNRSPGLTRDDIMVVAPKVAQKFLADDRRFAEAYYGIVLAFKGDRADHTREYLGLLANDLKGADPRAVPNEHDFANLHRAVWLLLYETIVRLLNFNIHGDWGDAPSGGTSQGYDLQVASSKVVFQFHNVPNLYGFFAVGTADYIAPNTGIVAAARREDANPHADRSLTDSDIRNMARMCARVMVDKPQLGERYLTIVKHYYADRGHHTAEYAKHVGTLLGAGPPPLSDDDFANVHRALWLFLVHRFECLVGENPFGGYAPVTSPVHSAPLPNGLRTLEVPNDLGKFHVNLADVDP